MPRVVITISNTSRLNYNWLNRDCVMHDCTLRPVSYLGGYFSKIPLTDFANLFVLRAGLELSDEVDTPWKTSWFRRAAPASTVRVPRNMGWTVVLDIALPQPASQPHPKPLELVNVVNTSSLWIDTLALITRSPPVWTRLSRRAESASSMKPTTRPCMSWLRSSPLGGPAQR